MATKPPKPTARKPGPKSAPRTPIADEILAAIQAYTAGGGTIAELARKAAETGLAAVTSSMIARFVSGERDLKLATVEALAVPLQLRLLQVGGRVGRGRA